MTNSNGALSTPSKLPDSMYANALYFIQIGEVNFLEMFMQAQQMGPGDAASSFAQQAKQQVHDGVMSSIESTIRQLYSAGGRRFLVLSVLSLSCAPVLRVGLGLAGLWSNGSCLAFADGITEEFNGQLGQRLAELRGSMAGSTIVYVRADLVLSVIVGQPQAHGFSASPDACCGWGPFNGVGPCGQGPNFTVCDAKENRIFWDQVHNTEAVFETVSAQLWQGAPPYVQPVNLPTALLAA